MTHVYDALADLILQQPWNLLVLNVGNGGNDPIH